MIIRVGVDSCLVLSTPCIVLWEKYSFLMDSCVGLFYMLLYDVFIRRKIITFVAIKWLVVHGVHVPF